MRIAGTTTRKTATWQTGNDPPDDAVPGRVRGDVRHGDPETSVCFPTVSFTTPGLTTAVPIDLISTIHAEEFGPAGSNG